MQCGKKQTKASLLSAVSHLETLSQSKQEQGLLIVMEKQRKHKNLLIYLITYDTLLTLLKSSVFIRATKLAPIDKSCSQKGENNKTHNERKPR